MSPQQPRGPNWTAIFGIGLTLLLNFGAAMFFGGAIASDVRYITKDVGKINERLDSRDNKDELQDDLANEMNGRLRSLETDMKAVKEGRYNNRIELLPGKTPAFGPQ